MALVVGGGRVVWPSYGGKVEAGVANCQTREYLK